MSGQFVDSAETKELAWEKARDYLAVLRVLGVNALLSVREVSKDNFWIELWPAELPTQRDGREGDT